MPEFDPEAPKPSTSNNKVDMVTGSGTDFVVQFWGVRGQISAPGDRTVRYGGNTSCVELRVGGKLLILDGGSGLRILGNNLLKQMPVKASIFFTHCHWDSIQGFPFFTPAFIPGNCFHLYGAAAVDGESIEQRIDSQMLAPNFPVPLKVMQSELQFHELTSGKKILLDDVTVETSFLNHDYCSMGYRISWQGHSVVYATSRAHHADKIDKDLLHLANQADLLILDAPHFLSIDEAFNSSVFNWQDDLWQTGIATAKQANVKQVVMSRYDPDYDDDFLDKLERQVQSVLPNHSLAREGMIVQVI